MNESVNGRGTERPAVQAKQGAEQQAGREARGDHDPGRRRFGQAALGTVPVLIAIYSNPLRASSGTPGNCHPSGWVSGNTSLHGDPGDCGGTSAGNFGNPGRGGRETGWEEWPFSEVFPGVPEYYEDPDLAHPLRLKRAAFSSGPARVFPVYDGWSGLVSNPERKVIRFGTAAWLSRHYGHYTFERPTEAEIVAMVVAALTGEPYSTAAGELDAWDVADFLENTLGNEAFK